MQRPLMLSSAGPTGRTRRGGCSEGETERQTGANTDVSGCRGNVPLQAAKGCGCSGFQAAAADLEMKQRQTSQR